MIPTIPDLSRCVILAVTSEIIDAVEEGDSIYEFFNIHYLNPMGFPQVKTWYEERYNPYDD
jgi:hypothetical protein